MIYLLTALAALGIAFALQNKLPDALDTLPFVGKMLACSFCSGFHAGWIAYLVVFQGRSISEAVGFAFATAFVYWWDMDRRDSE